MQISETEIHLHIQLPHMPDMPDLPGTSQHEEEQQGPAPGALDVRRDIEQSIEDMPQGPAKDFLLHENDGISDTGLSLPQRTKVASLFMSLEKISLVMSLQGDEGWPLGLPPVTLRMRLVEAFSAAGAGDARTSFVLNNTPSFSSLSSSDLDTEVLATNEFT
ncbi:hypothetical protein L7F22_044369 [Adiantum nelumboides]|nr:hypothetical protein [Adiantum nelumboides]